MKKLLFTFFLLCLACGAQGQNISQEELTAFCERAIENHIRTDSSGFDILILKDSLLPTTKTIYPNFKVRYILRNQIFDIMKERKQKLAEIFVAKFIKKGNDTLYITFSSFKARKKGRKKIYYHSFPICADYNLARLTFDHTDKKWQYASGQDLRAEAYEKREKRRKEWEEYRKKRSAKD